MYINKYLCWRSRLFCNSSISIFFSCSQRHVNFTPVQLECILSPFEIIPSEDKIRFASFLERLIYWNDGNGQSLGVAWCDEWIKGDGKSVRKSKPVQFLGICTRLFSYRKQQTWPPKLEIHDDWRESYDEWRDLPSVKPTLEEAVRWANEFISEIDNSR